MKTSSKIHGFAAVYKLINLKNGKIYIGSTKNLHKRFAEYRAYGRPKMVCGRLIELAIKKHGLDSFDFEVLEKIGDLTALVEREQYWLDKLKPFGCHGYNILENAESRVGYKHTERTKEKLSNGLKGRTFSEEHRKNLSKANLDRVEDIRSQMSVPCLQIDMKTLFVIKEYSSMHEASETLAKQGVLADESNISRACNRESTSCVGFYWCRKDDYEKNGFTPKKIARRFGSPYCVPVYQMSLDGEIIQAWESAEEARRHLGLKRSKIWDCLNAKKSDAHGFKWAKIEDSELKNQIINDRRSRLAKLRAEEAAQL